MIKHCLGCDIEFDGSPQSKYHNEACSDKARKRKMRGATSDLSGAPVVSKGDSKIADGIPGYLTNESVEGLERVKRDPWIELSGGEKMLILEPLDFAPLDPSLKNTINDPNPDWAPDKIITDNNRTMTCPICGKLSLTHKRIEDGGTGPCFPYMGRTSSKGALDGR